jgi:SP family myo-inositol transporter-like MFS transporter 13
MSIGLTLCAVAFKYVDLPSEITAVESPQPQPAPNSTAPLIIVLSIIIYTASYAIGLGNVPWMQSELFPLNVRSLGSALSTSTNWGANFVIGLTFLPMMEWLTPTWTFVIYAVVCAIGWSAIWKIYPETKGLGLEEVGKLLESGWGVEETTA